MTQDGHHSVEERLDELESRVAISRLAASYCEGVDHKQLGLFSTLWFDDARFVIPGGRGEFVGIDQIRASQEGVAKAWARTWHWTTNHTVDFQGADRATGRADVFAICEMHGGKGTCLVSGTYSDIYERREGSWRFAERTINRWFVTPAQAIPLPPPA